MKASIWRHIAGLTAAMLILSGCGGLQNQSSGVAALPTANQSVTRHGQSWMLREATTENLLYAVGGCNHTCVFSYPQGKLVGTLSNAGAAICSDQLGNVFIPLNGTVTEYAHGGTSPIATFNLPGSDARGCSVDSVTNNLAVLFDGSGTDVAIFPNEGGTPALYAAVLDVLYCGYDGAGNLFVDGLNGSNPGLAELPYGGTSFSNLSVSGSVGFPGQVQWDGQYITYEGVDQGNVQISRLSISGSAATVVGTTSLTLHSKASASWIFGNRVLVPHPARRNLRTRNTIISFFNYPAGGAPSKSIKRYGDFKKIDTNFEGVTVSVHR